MPNFVNAQWSAKNPLTWTEPVALVQRRYSTVGIVVRVLSYAVLVVGFAIFLAAGRAEALDGRPDDLPVWGGVVIAALFVAVIWGLCELPWGYRQIVVTDEKLSRNPHPMTFAVGGPLIPLLAMKSWKPSQVAAITVIGDDPAYGHGVLRVASAGGKVDVLGLAPEPSVEVITAALRRAGFEVEEEAGT